MAFQEQERLLAELIGPRETPVAERPKPARAAAQERAAQGNAADGLESDEAGREDPRRNPKHIHMNEVQDSAKERGHALGTFARFFRWLFSWRGMRRWLFALACLATLTGLFYAVENWRGKRAWEKCRRELEAKGEVLDWNAFIPAPVPDEQNIFKAPKMTEWFVKGSLTEAVGSDASKSRSTNAPFSFVPRRDAKNAPVLVAEVDVVPSNGPLPPGKADAVLRFDDPAAPEQAAKLLDDSHRAVLSRGARAELIVARPRIRSSRCTWCVQADTVPTPKALAEFLPHSPGPYQVGTVLRRDDCEVEPAGSNVFRVSLKPSVYTAADYLAASQPAVPDLDLLRKGARAPLRADGQRLPAAL